MGKWIVIGICMLSGVGTVPCMIYLIWATMMESKDAQDEATKQAALEKSQRNHWML